MIAQELEVSLHMAFVEARQKRHEFITVEHLLLALLDNPTAAEVLRACGANIDELRKNLTQYITEQTPRIAADRRGRHPADARLPARDPARHPARAVLRQEGSHRRQRAGGDLRREGFARGVFPAPAGHHAARRGQLHLARHHQDRAAAPGQGRAGGRAGEPGRSRQQPARQLHPEPERAGARRQDRPADRPRPRARARDPDAVPPAQEQSAAGRRGRGRQDRDRRRAGAAHRRGQRARAAGRSARCTRSTWARCSRAPSTAATSSSA